MYDYVQREGGLPMREYMNRIIGNSALRKRLCEDIISNGFSHAYIIEGIKGSGKHTLSMLTAAALSCKKKHDAHVPLPCMECESCSKILRDLSPDVVKVSSEGKATLGVDKIRFLKEDVYIPPNDLDAKIYIIEDADRLTAQAQNAFLLTLEEPPAYVVFLLLCENSGALLETIRSRAPILRTEPIPNELIDEYISQNDTRAASMKQNAPSEYKELIMAAENGIGRALELLEQRSFDSVLTQRKLAKDFIATALSRFDPQQALTLGTRFSSKRDGLSRELELIRAALRDLILSKKSDNAPLCFYESREDAIDLSDNTSIRRLLDLMECVQRASERISLNANVKLTVTSLLSECDMI